MNSAQGVIQINLENSHFGVAINRFEVNMDHNDLRPAGALFDSEIKSCAIEKWHLTTNSPPDSQIPSVLL